MDIVKKNSRSIFIILALVISVFGLFMVYDASLIWGNYKYGDKLYFFKRQIVFLIIGLVIFYIMSKINLIRIYKNSTTFIFVSILLLILVLIPGIGQVRNGSRSWFGFASFGFQPSELFKVTSMIFGAKLLSDNYRKTDKVKSFIPLIGVAILGFLLIMLEPDFGTGIVMMCSLVGLSFLSKFKARYYLILGVIGSLFIVILVAIAPYRFERITAFLDPFSDPLGSGFQIIQSLYALGPGGLVGNGIFGSLQKHFYLPEPQTDFIFAIIVEELGLIGGLLILALYALLFYEGFKYAAKSTTMFESFLKSGLLIQIAIQTIINLMVVVGLIPVTGITLPLISYGGSSLLITLFSLGIVANKGEQDEDCFSNGGKWGSHYSCESLKRLFRKKS